jgi:beta-aspartyl peptidase
MITLLKHARILQNGTWMEGELLIAGEKIAAVGPKLDCTFPGMEIIDAEGMRCIPGYLDQHVHITGGGGEGGFANQVPPLKASAPVRAGVTTLVGLLGTDGTTRSVESLVAKTKAFNELGLTAFCLTGAYEFPSPTVTGSIKKDIVMIAECIGVKVAISDHRSMNMEKRDLVWLASQARQAGILSGKPGITHLHTGSGKAELDLLFDIVETTELPVFNLRPTHLGGKFEAAMRWAALGGYADFTCGDNHAKTAGIIARALERAPEGRVTMSTDGNGSMPVWNEKKEMIGIGAGRIHNLHGVVKALVQEKGLPLEAALAPCTENVAKALNLYPRKGCIAPGSDADLLLLDDGLAVDTVIARGKTMLRHGALCFRANFED